MNASLIAMKTKLSFFILSFAAFVLVSGQSNGHRCYECKKKANGQLMTRGECLRKGNIKSCCGSETGCETHVYLGAGRDGQDLIHSGCKDLDACKYHEKSTSYDREKQLRCCCEGSECNEYDIRTSCGNQPTTTTPTTTTPKKSCGPPPVAPANGARGVQSRQGDTLYIDYTCNDKYCLKGSKTLTCPPSTKVWTPQVPICEPEKCTFGNNNILLVIDISGSISSDDFGHVKTFISTMAQDLKNKNANTKIGIVTFGTYSNDVTGGFLVNGKKLENLIKGLTKKENPKLKKGEPKISSGYTCTGTGIKTAFDSFQSYQKRTDETDVPVEVWLLTDGKVSCPRFITKKGKKSRQFVDEQEQEDAITYAGRFRSKKAEVHAIAIGDKKTRAKFTGFLKELSPNNKVVQVKDFKSLVTNALQSMKETCGCF